MLDFIGWLTQQDFGRRCILSVRDILSWVNFLNAVRQPDSSSSMSVEALEEEEAAASGLDTITAFVHAACLVYIDGIGSGELTACLSVGVRARVWVWSLVWFFLQEPQRRVQTMLSQLGRCAWASCSRGCGR